jgi:hypothetical protein
VVKALTLPARGSPRRSCALRCAWGTRRAFPRRA